MEKSEYKALKEQLFSRRRNGFDRLDGAERGALEAYCTDYKAFLDAGKTERLCAAESDPPGGGGRLPPLCPGHGG